MVLKSLSRRIIFLSIIKNEALRWGHLSIFLKFETFIFQLSQYGSKFNFDCRNRFLGVDYIGLDISQSKIDGFYQGGGIGIGKIITKEACMPKITVLAPKMWLCTPTLFFSYLSYL